MKRVLLPLLFAAVLLAGAGCFTTTVNVNVTSTNTNTSEAANIVTLVINKGDNDTATYTEDYESGQTAYELLQEVAADNGFAITMDEFDFGILITGIDGLQATSDHFWLYYVNNEQPTVGSDVYELMDGDTVEFRYEASTL